MQLILGVCWGVGLLGCSTSHRAVVMFHGAGSVQLLSSGRPVHLPKFGGQPCVKTAPGEQQHPFPLPFSFSQEKFD